MWTWRNMENISWKDHITNEYVLGQVNDIKADETYEKIKRRAMDRECWRNWMPRTCFQAEHQ